METNTIEILARSSSGSSYTVKFFISENNISAFCSCPAGKNRKLCKHIIKICEGDSSILYDNDQIPLLYKLQSYIANTNISLLLSKLNESEMLLKKAQQHIKKIKRNLEMEILSK